MGNIEIFDQIAKTYNTPDRIKISIACANEIRKYLVDGNNKSAIDFGCGTGLVGLPLANEFQSILFVDASKNMIQYVKEKIKENNINNAEGIAFDLEENQKEIEPVDYIIVVQVLLHIQDTDAILSKLHSLLKKDGHLIIIDFNKNDLVNSEMVHNGFEQKELKSILKKIGYQDISSDTFYQGKEIFMKQDASLFIMDARK
ncbi:MAG: class I SAM-dependent methyltransferase [Coprobacillaceae bacterium]